MPEPLNSTALVPVDGDYLIKVKEFDAAGKTHELECTIPASGRFEEWTMKQQIVMLKKGTWSNSSIPDIIWGLTYARQIGADVMRGELFPLGNGRWGTSNKFKIKAALRTGKVRGITVDMKPLNAPAPTGCDAKSDLECTVTIEVEGWTKPIVRVAKLSRWFKGNNPNWKGNPEHMLELNTVAHALEYVEPTATEDDEFVPETPAVK